MPNMLTAIQGNNKRNHSKLKTDNDISKTDEKKCNCRAVTSSTLNGNCLQSGVISRTKVKSDDKLKRNHTLDSHPLPRYNNHKSSFNNERKKNITELGKYISGLKKSKKEFTIKWCIITQETP